MFDQMNIAQLAVQNFGVIVASIVVTFLLHHLRYKCEPFKAQLAGTEMEMNSSRRSEATKCR